MVCQLLTTIGQSQPSILTICVQVNYQGRTVEQKHKQELYKIVHLAGQKGR